MLVSLKPLLRRIYLAAVAAAICAALSGCSSANDPGPVDCALDGPQLVLSAKQNPGSCAQVNGRIDVTASGGRPPYQYKINSDPFQNNSVFSNLLGGSYIIRVRDSNGCESMLNVELITPEMSFTIATASVADTECLTGNGRITLTATGEHPPFQFRLGNGVFTEVNTFDNLNEGNHTLQVRDNTGCTLVVNAVVPRGQTNTSFASAVNPIVMNKCATANCHNGSNSSIPNYTNFNALKNNASRIRTRVIARTMPPTGSPPLTADELALLVCWIDDGAPQN